MENIGALAKSLQQYGRHGDSILAHISPREAGILRQFGGAGTRNPRTGLLEYFGPNDGGPGPGEGGTGGGPGGAGAGGGDGPAGGNAGGPGDPGGDDADAGPASGLGPGAATDISAGLGNALGGISPGVNDTGGVAAGSEPIDFTDAAIRSRRLDTRPQVGTTQFGKAVGLARQAALDNPTAAAVVGALARGIMPGPMSLGIGALNAATGRPISGGLSGFGTAPSPDDISMEGRGESDPNAGPGGSGDVLSPSLPPPVPAPALPAPPLDPRLANAPPTSYLESDPFTGRISRYQPRGPEFTF